MSEMRHEGHRTERVDGKNMDELDNLKRIIGYVYDTWRANGQQPFEGDKADTEFILGKIQEFAKNEPRTHIYGFDLEALAQGIFKPSPVEHPTPVKDADDIEPPNEEIDETI
jgi:hypothetical protein